MEQNHKCDDNHKQELEKELMHKHEHSHHHSHNHRLTALNRAFKFGIAINIIYVLVEAVCGLYFHSMGLLSDAGHNLTDVASLALALIAYKLASHAASENYTYGYKKSTILISLINGIILCVAVIFIITESIGKFFHPTPLQGGLISFIAAIGVLVNGFTTMLFFKNSGNDLNVKGAFLHMLADTLVSVGVVAAGIIIYYTGWYAIDGIIGLIVSVVIILATWELLRDSIRLALDGVPKHLDKAKIINHFKDTDGVVEMHHLHVWALSTTDNALTAHVVIKDLAQMDQIKQVLKQKLRESDIAHVTLEFETIDTPCDGSCS